MGMGTLSVPRKVTVLGSTGSVGVSTLELFEQAGEAVDMVALVAGRNADRLADQALRWRPKVAVVQDERAYPRLRERLAGSGIEAAAGEAAVVEAAQRPTDWVMSAIVGFAGLAPTLAAARAGAVIALANKESLICAGPELLRTAKQSGGAVIPVDSEHSAIFQVFEPQNAAQVSRLVLTASGGPFRSWSREQMAQASPEQALAHPNWNMGAKISVDSATLMNKGLELIEAHYLFGITPERLDVVVHPQSIVHSLVSYVDGSVLAQLASPDMRTPIAFALGFPERMSAPTTRLDLAAVGQLTFEAADPVRFPCLGLAQLALRAGGGAPTILNAANEVAVEAFLAGKIGFLDIGRTVESTLERTVSPADSKLNSLDEFVSLDGDARSVARRLIGSLS